MQGCMGSGICRIPFVIVVVKSAEVCTVLNLDFMTIPTRQSMSLVYRPGKCILDAVVWSCKSAKPAPWAQVTDLTTQEFHPIPTRWNCALPRLRWDRPLGIFGFQFLQSLSADAGLCLRPTCMLMLRRKGMAIYRQPRPELLFIFEAELKLREEKFLGGEDTEVEKCFVIIQDA